MLRLILSTTLLLSAFANPLDRFLNRKNEIPQKTPFPQWLKDLTGLSQWPGLDPPYIPLDFIDFNKIPQVPRYKQGHCSIVPKAACSFDCDSCAEPDDVYTCPKLSQTFDDGPSPATDLLLQHLKNHKTTFFNLGINVVTYPQIYNRMQTAGHLIGTHTWSHAYLPNLSNEQIIAQIQWSIWAMNATGNHLPKWFRPPYGGIDNRVRSITRQFGLQAVLWDRDTFDWKILTNDQTQTESKIYHNVKNWLTDKKGLILEHDGSQKTVEIALNVHALIGDDQLTVAQCVGGQDYIKQY